VVKKNSCLLCHLKAFTVSTGAHKEFKEKNSDKSHCGQLVLTCVTTAYISANNKMTYKNILKLLMFSTSTEKWEEASEKREVKQVPELGKTCAVVVLSYQL
jgi:hypothetical protein